VTFFVFVSSQESDNQTQCSISIGGSNMSDNVALSDINVPGLQIRSNSEGPEKATRGGEWEPIKIPHRELGIYPKINSTPLSSNSAKTP
jgi:hypothetical protein